MRDVPIGISRRQINSPIWINRGQTNGVTIDIIVMRRIDRSLGLLRNLRVLLFNIQQILFESNGAGIIGAVKAILALDVASRA